jgi:nucleotide-binding universal stress UspA family protein
MKIVVGFDGSEPARRALDRAAGLAKAGDPVSVVTVADVTVTKGGMTPDAPKTAARKEALDEAKKALGAKGVTVETVLADGDPGDAIIAEAEKAGADLIVVGTRGLNAAERLLLGSVSTKVVHHAKCDVLVVR